MGIEEKRRARGERLDGVDSKPDVDAFEPRSDDYGRRARTFDGLGFQTGWLWAGVTADDGRRYALLREHEVGCTNPHDGLQIAPDIRPQAVIIMPPSPPVDDLYCGAVRYEPDGEAHSISSTNPVYPPTTVSLSPSGHTWREADWMDVTMEPLGVAMRYRCPGAARRLRVHESDLSGHRSVHGQARPWLRRLRPLLRRARRGLGSEQGLSIPRGAVVGLGWRARRRTPGARHRYQRPR